MRHTKASKVEQINKSTLKIQRQLDAVLNSIPGGHWWKDVHGHYLGCNETVAQLTGLSSPEQIIGKTDYDMPWSSSAKLLIEHDRLVIHAKKTMTFEEAIDMNGQTIYLFASKAPLFNEFGEIIGIVGTTIDITKLKELENSLRHAQKRAEAANQLKAEFIENMQHDIRTPISGIWSMLDSMSRSDDMESFKPFIPHMLKAAAELLELCNDVIDFENIDYGNKTITERKFSLYALAHSAINLNSAAALSHSNSLELIIDKDVPDIIKGDDYRLKKIIINLVGNAIKFTEQGKVVFHIEKINQSKKKVTLRFSITDTGIGIPEEKLDSIFEKFSKLTPSSTNKFKGTGLGLHVVKKFAHEIDAELDVTSQIGIGSEFTLDACFDLPLVDRLGSSAKAPPSELTRHLMIHSEEEDNNNNKIISKNKPITSHQKKNIVNNKKLNILIIEDDKIAMLMAEKRFLDAAPNCDIAKAENVRDTLKLLQQKKFDLIVSDLGLPDGTGFDIITMVKKDLNHLNINTPFIALTAHSDDAKLQQAKETGFLALYNKPLLAQQTEIILDNFVATKLSSQTMNETIDLAASTRITGGNKATTLELIDLLVTSFNKEKAFFEIAFHNNDYSQARALFHKLRGGLSYVKAPKVEQLARKLHEEVKALEDTHGDLQPLYPKFLLLVDEIEEVRRWLNKTHELSNEP